MESELTRRTVCDDGSWLKGNVERNRARLSTCVRGGILKEMV